MHCPVDGTELVIADRTGVEIDYCPTCRGVWLDRGELDKIIERATRYSPPPPPRDAVSSEKPRKKKRGGLADLFDDIFDF